MNRTFAHRVTVPALVSVVLIAALALFFFWQRRPAMVVVAAVLTIVDVAAIEKLIHTTYTFTGDGILVISRGRFAARQAIDLAKVRNVSRQRAPLGIYKYVMIEYGADKVATAMTENDDAFVHEITKRIKKIDDED